MARNRCAVSYLAKASGIPKQQRPAAPGDPGQYPTDQLRLLFVRNLEASAYIGEQSRKSSQLYGFSWPLYHCFLISSLTSLLFGSTWPSLPFLNTCCVFFQNKSMEVDFER